MRLGMDFAVAGPVKRTSSHPEQRPLGWEEFTSLVQGSSIPVYAIGGLRMPELETAWRHGAHGLAMIRGSWD